MLNYIRAEFYKLLRRKYTYITLGIMLALETMLVASYVFHNSHSFATPFGGAVPIITEMGIIGFSVCLLTADIVFAGQYKNSTLKNEVSFGLSRTRIYLGKLISQTLLSIIYLVVMIGFFLGACAIVLPLEGDGFYSASDALAIVGYFLAAGLPLWIGTQAAACMCQFLISGDAASSVAYMGLILMLGPTVELAGYLIRPNTIGDALLKLSGYFPSPMLDGVRSRVGDCGYLGQCWLVGAVWLAVTTAIGLYVFNRKEIK